MSHILRAAADLIIGAACSGCGHPGRILCNQCRDGLRPRPQAINLDPLPWEFEAQTHLKIWSAGPYRAPLQGALVDYKEHGKFSILPELGFNLAAAVVASIGQAEAVTLVPIPSRTVANVTRGYNVMRELAKFCVQTLATVGVRADVAQTLTFTRIVRDQGALSGAQRRRNLSGSMKARAGSPRLFIGGTVDDSPGSHNPRLIIIDDIVTTGSTVAEAVRALRSGGAQPQAIACIATTAESWRWPRGESRR